MLVDDVLRFQSKTDLTKKGIREAAEIAFKLAKASSKHVPTPVKLAPIKADEAFYKAIVTLTCSFLQL